MEWDYRSGQCRKIMGEAAPTTVFRPGPDKVEDLRAEKRLGSLVLQGDRKAIMLDSFYLLFTLVCLVLMKSYTSSCKS